MELEEAMKEMKIEIEQFENDLKALEKTDIDVEYKIQIVNELTEYILVRQAILNHLAKQEKMIELMVIELAEQYDHYEPCWLECEDNIKCDNQESCKECVKRYFEKKAEEIS